VLLEVGGWGGKSSPNVKIARIDSYKIIRKRWGESFKTSGQDNDPQEEPESAKGERVFMAIKKKRPNFLTAKH